MQPQELLSYYIILIGAVALAGFAYLILLINKRRKNNFLHPRKKTPKGS